MLVLLVILFLKKDLVGSSKLYSFVPLLALSLCLLFYYTLSISGLQTVLTVVLTISLLLLTPKSELLSKLLSSKPMTQIGLISYSLYLWHWPVIVFRKWTLSPSLNNLVFQVVFMTVLAYLSYYFIESKFRYKLWTKKPITTIALGFSLFVF